MIEIFVMFVSGFMMCISTFAFEDEPLSKTTRIFAGISGVTFWLIFVYCVISILIKGSLL